MLYLYTAQVMASEAQRRHLDGVRLDGPITNKPSRWQSLVAALFTRSTPATGHARTRLNRVAAA
jgi:hypothetical protein